MVNADWNRGIWTNGNVGSGQLADEAVTRLTIGSDWLPMYAYEQMMKGAPVAVYGDLLPILRASDLNLVNVECTFGERGEPIPKAGPNFRAEAGMVRSLVEVPFHVACMANNHIMDYGPDSLTETLKVLKRAGLHTVGAGMSGEEAAKPLLIKSGQTRVAIVNCAEGEACRSVDGGPGAYGFEPEVAALQIRALKREADVVLVIFHGGREFAPLPPVYVVEALRGMAEAGASAIVAHHPHVPQGIEVYGGVPIVYSQGNFAFWMDEDSFYRHAGYLVHLDVAPSGVQAMEITPYMIEREGLSVMRGDLKAGFLRMLRTVSDLLADPDNVRVVWQAFVDVVGLSGMKNILKASLAKMEQDECVGAARMLNWFHTPAHSKLFIDGLRRASAGRIGQSPEWAKRLVEQWNQCSIEEGKSLCIASPNHFLGNEWTFR